MCRRVSVTPETIVWLAPGNRISRPLPAELSICTTGTLPNDSSVTGAVNPPCRQFGRDHTRNQVQGSAAPKVWTGNRSPWSGSMTGRSWPLDGSAPGGTTVLRPTPPRMPFNRGVACGAVPLPAPKNGANGRLFPDWSATPKTAVVHPAAVVPPDVRIPA